MNKSYPALWVVILFLLFAVEIPAQDTIRLMQYNLLNYGANTGYCDATNNNTNTKNTALKKIIAYTDPDIFCVNELGSNPVYADQLMNNVLIPATGRNWQRIDLAFTTNSSICNMLYYDADKFGYSKHYKITDDVNNIPLTRLIDVVRLYVNDTALLNKQDTLFLNCCVAHLKAGSTSSDLGKRNDAVTALMDFLNTEALGNTVFSGDFNLSGSSESSYQTATSYQNSQIVFKDPIAQPGYWHSNAGYAAIHTQSTHNVTDCAVGGGLDDRFDFILLNNMALNGYDRIRYLPGSYTALGNGGNNFNTLLITSGNAAVPDSIAQALYTMSDHLPVYVDFRVSHELSGLPVSQKTSGLHYANPVNGRFWFQFNRAQTTNEGHLTILDMSGRVVFEDRFTGNHYTGDPVLSPGLYIAKIKSTGVAPMLFRFVVSR